MPNHKAKMNQENRANQSDRHRTNINSIIANYTATGQAPHVPAHTPLYGDFTQSFDLQDTLDRVREAELAFNALPAVIRAAADNDKVKFLDMVGDTDGRELLESLGLVVDEVDDQAEAKPPLKSEENPAPDSQETESPEG